MPTTLPNEHLWVLFLGVLLHELGHRIVVWWSRGNCSTPQMLTAKAGEAGEYVETQIFGGVLEGWWDSGSLGDFQRLRSVAVEAPDGLLFLLGMSYCAAPASLAEKLPSDRKLSKKILSFDKPQRSLPLIDVQHLTPVSLPGPSLQRSKITTKDIRDAFHAMARKYKIVSQKEFETMGLQRTRIGPNDQYE
jgi:hypothetical protein